MNAPDDAATDLALRAATEAIFAALERRDVAAVEAYLADEFVLRIPGQPDTDRAAFLAEIAALPDGIEAVTGEGVAVASPDPGVGVVTGAQIARVRVDGQLVVDRGAFSDVFLWRDGRWQLVLAFNVPLPPAP